MSYSEYEDLFIKCQNTAPYNMFLYDVVNSRNELDNKSRNKILELLFNVYERIQKIEKEEKRKILHTSKELIKTKLVQYVKNNELCNKIEFEKKPFREDLQEPFAINGDMFGFTILRGTMTEKEIDGIFEEEKESLKIIQQFHKANGFYETDKYEEGNKLYFRGYCMQQLEKDSKRESEIER